MSKVIPVLLAWLLVPGSARARPQFDPRTETFAFSNDTVFSYGVNEIGRLTMQRREKAPNFSLPDQNGKPVALADLLSPNGAILIFYRGHW